MDSGILVPRTLSIWTGRMQILPSDVGLVFVLPKAMPYATRVGSDMGLVEVESLLRLVADRFAEGDVALIPWQRVQIQSDFGIGLMGT